MNQYVSIITLQYNNADLTIEFLESLWKISYDKYRITIVDNQSTDDSLIKLQKYLSDKFLNYNIIKYDHKKKFRETKISNSKINIIQSDKNGGYAYGCNIGLNYSLINKTDFYLVINNDVEVTSNFLEPLILSSEKNKNLGLISCKIYYHNTDKLIWFNGGSINNYTGKLVHYDYRKKDRNTKINNKITFLSGCTWFIPHDPLLDVGLIDDSYFFYCEDIDYSLRFLKKGYSLSVCQESIVYHKKNPKDEEISELNQKYLTIGKKMIINKYFKRHKWLTATIFHIFYPILRYIYLRQLNLMKVHFVSLFKKAYNK